MIKELALSTYAGNDSIKLNRQRNEMIHFSLCKLLYPKKFVYKFHSYSTLNKNLVSFTLFVRYYIRFPQIKKLSIHKHSLNSHRNRMDLASVVKVIEKIIPPELAEEWDNTGLLIGPPCTAKVSLILLTNDLTEEVLKDAVAMKANMIISYHPPIFSSIKLFQSKNWKDRVIMSCISNDIAVYSPHTACDAVKGGVNDWLISCFDFKDVSPIRKNYEPGKNVMEFYAPLKFDLEALLNGIEYNLVIKTKDTGLELFLERYKLLVGEKETYKAYQILESHENITSITVQPCKSIHRSGGMGRLANLKNPIKMRDCIQLVKKHINLDCVRVSFAVGTDLDTEIETVAVCAGSGGSVLQNVSAQLLVTGEMSHHDLLDAAHRNRTVILCEHSNSERGYLPTLQKELISRLDGVDVRVSNVDRDPVTMM